MIAPLNILQGFKTVRSAGRLVVFLYLVNLGFSMVLAVPMHNSLADSFGRSRAGENMAREFDFLWWQEYRDRGRGLSSTFGPSVIGRGALLNNLEGLLQMKLVGFPAEFLVVFLIYILLRTFLAGGILHLFREGVPEFNLRRFLDGSLGNFPSFLGLTLLSWVLFFGVGFVLVPKLDEAAQRISASALTELPGFWAGLAASLAAGLVFFLIQAIFDYARVKIVLEERRNIFRAFGEGLVFVLKHPLASLGLYLSLCVAGLVLSVLYVLLKENAAFPGWGGVLLAFTWQQLFVLGLAGLRCWTYASELHLARYFRP